MRQQPPAPAGTSNRAVMTIVILLGMAFLSACGWSPAPQEIVSTLEVVVTVPVTPTAAPPDGDEPASTEAAQQPAATRTPNSLQATLDALMAGAPRPDAGSSTPATAIAPDDYVGMFEHAWRIVQENYVRDDFNGVDWEEVHDNFLPQVEAVTSREEFWTVMENMIATLGDDHSRFVRPDRFAVEFGLPSQEPGQPWPGMTIWPAREDEALFIWDVCDRGPAAEAGLQRGDVVLAINGEPVERGEKGFDYAAIRQVLYGVDVREVTLTVQQGPDAEPREVHIEYGGAAGCDGWFYAILSEDPYIGYLRIPDFDGDSARMILEGIGLLEEDRPLDGLVLDVRHNPGGNSDSSIAIFTEGLFGKTGPLREGATQTLYRIRGPVRWNETTPVALLIDGSSHSAAEYFATAMQQSGRAVLVGMPTAGNTEGITGFSLPDGSLIRLAVMTLQLPDGSTLEDTGVIPDIRVPLGMWGLREMPDVQLREAFDAVLEQIR